MQIIGQRLGLGNNTASRVRGELAFLSQVPPMLRKKIGQGDMWTVEYIRYREGSRLFDCC